MIPLIAFAFAAGMLAALALLGSTLQHPARGGEVLVPAPVPGLLAPRGIRRPFPKTQFCENRFDLNSIREVRGSRTLYRCRCQSGGFNRI